MQEASKGRVIRENDVSKSIAKEESLTYARDFRTSIWVQKKFGLLKLRRKLESFLALEARTDVSRKREPSKEGKTV